MNEVAVVIAIFVCTFAVIAAYSVCKELFRRWYEDDWCRHSWSTWNDNGLQYEQVRYCSKCNKKERRHV